MKKKYKIFLIILISLIAFGALLILSAGGLLTYFMINERVTYEKLEDPSAFNVESEEVRLLTSDNYNIRAYDVSVENPKGYIIIISGIQSPSVTAFYGYSRAFREIGFSSLLIEMRAHGESDGEKIMLGYEEELDVNAGVNYIDSKNPDIPIIVMGTSMGGAVAINATAKNSRIDGVISQSAFSSWEENIMDQFTINGFPSFLSRHQIPFTRFLLGLKYGFKNIGNSPINNISGIEPSKILLMHSKEDSQVIYNNYLRLKEQVKEPFDNYVVSGDKHFIIESGEEFNYPKLNSEYFTKLESFLTKIVNSQQ